MFYLWFYHGKQNDKPYLHIWAMPFIFISTSNHLYYRYFIMAMPLKMILIRCVIPRILSCDFSKLIILYIHVYNLYIISMTNKSAMTLLYVTIKYLSVCVCLLLNRIETI